MRAPAKLTAPRATTAIAWLAAALLTVGCDGPRAAESLLAPGGLEAASQKKLGPEGCAFGQAFTLAPGNPWFPLGVGSEWTLEGEEDDEQIQLVVEVLDETETVGGVDTRVVRETESVDGEVIEISRNFFAGTEDGTVCYFGEDVDIFEEDGSVTHEGAWRADEGDNFPGIIMPADPRPGVKYLMEGAPEIAEDVGKVVGVGPVHTAAGSFESAIRVREASLIDSGFDFKVFAEGIGIVIDGPLSLVGYTVEPE